MDNLSSISTSTGGGSVTPSPTIEDLRGELFSVAFPSDPPLRNYQEESIKNKKEKKSMPSAIKIKMSSVIISDDKMEQIRSAISQLEHKDKIFNEWGFSKVFEKGTAITMLFHGIPGTGKTLMAQAVADLLSWDLQILGTADIETSEPGGAERNIKKAFADAREKFKHNQAYGSGKPTLLLFDECDSLLVDRNSVGVILAAQINPLLSELEAFDGIVIMTTNRLGQLDPALERRITAKIEFEFPTKTQRKAIWRRMIPSKASLSSDVKLDKLAEIPIVGGNIKNAVLNAARLAAFRGLDEISKDCFDNAIEKELKGLQQFLSSIEQDKHLNRVRSGSDVLKAAAKKGGIGLEIDSGSRKIASISEAVDTAFEELKSLDKKGK